MADSQTTNYSLTKPEVGASEDTWGEKLNTNADTIDSQLKTNADAAAAAQSTADAALPKAGGTVTGAITTTADINFGDNDKAIFGAGNDLQIYHDTVNSVIKDAGTGNLELLGNNLRLKNADATASYLNGNNGSNVEIYHSGQVKLTTTSTGIDVTGTATMDGLTVDNNANNTFKLRRDNSLSPFGSVDVQSISGGTTYYSGALEHYDGQWRIKTQTTSATRNPLNRATFDVNGDISFYEDTGTTAKFFWDASAESLGIGTASPYADTDLHILNSATSTGLELSCGSAESNAIRLFAYDRGTGTNNDLMMRSSNFIVQTNGANERMRIDSSGNVGIGTSSPNEKLRVVGTSGNVQFGAGTGGNAVFVNAYDSGSIYMTASAANSTAFGLGSASNIPTFFMTNNTERMRIDSSGNLLVGKSGTSFSTDGVEIKNDQIWSTNTSSDCISLNRKTTDGALATFYKDGTTVGSIGAEGGDLVLGTGSTAGIQFNDATPTIRPWNMSANTRTDGVCDLGYSNSRFKDLYLSGGVYLGGTGAANKLEDYEEGTFTPVFTGANGVPLTATYRSALGTYVKVGNVVTISMVLAMGSLSGSSVNLGVGGLPFTQQAGNSNYGASTGLFRYLSTPANAYPVVEFVPSSAYGNILFINSGTTTSSASTASITNTNAFDVNIRFSYIAA